MSALEFFKSKIEKIKQPDQLRNIDTEHFFTIEAPYLLHKAIIAGEHYFENIIEDTRELYGKLEQELLNDLRKENESEKVEDDQEAIKEPTEENHNAGKEPREHQEAIGDQKVVVDAHKSIENSLEIEGTEKNKDKAENNDNHSQPNLIEVRDENVDDSEIIQVKEGEDNKTLDSKPELEISLAAKEQLLKQIHDFDSAYLKHFLKLSDDVRRSLNNILDGKEVNNVDYKVFIDYFLLKEMRNILSQPSNVEAGIWKNQNLFKINILLAYLDEYLSCENTTFDLLKSIAKHLSEEIYDEKDLNIISNILSQKAEFLKFKIEFREKLPNGDHKSTDGVQIQNASNYFYDFYQEIIKHYSVLSSEQIKQMNNAVSNNFNATCFHHLKRYHCRKGNGNDLKTTKRLINILNSKLEDGIKKLKSKPSTHASIFDEVSAITVKNLLANATLEIKLRTEAEEDYSTIKEEISKYIVSGKEEDLQFLKGIFKTLVNRNSKPYIKDYFGLKLLYEFLHHMISHFKENSQFIFEESENSNNLVSLNDKKSRVNKLIKLIDTFYKKIYYRLRELYKYVSSYRSLPVMLPFEENLIEIRYDSGSTIKVFLKSGYILPINYNQLELKIDYWESHLENQIATLKDAFDIKFNQQEIKNSFGDFDKRVKDNEFKIVQIVAMFVSIATFVLMNVKVFDNKSGIESFAIIIGLAGVFILFNVFFYVIIIAQYKSFKNFWLVVSRFAAFIFAPLVLCLCSWLLLRNEQFSNNPNYNTIINNIDSSRNRIRLNDEQISVLVEKIRKDSIIIEHMKNRINHLENFYK